MIATLAGEKLEDKKIGRVKSGDADVVQVFIGLRDVVANQYAKLLHGYTQLLSRLHFGVLRLVLLGGERACVHGLNAF